MIVWGWWTRGAESASTQVVVPGPQWVYDTHGHRNRIYPPRTRGDVWGQFGDLRNEDPALDTWEGEAT